VQSSDEAALRITPDLLSKLVQIADVDDLQRSGRDAWSGDVTLAGSMSGEFGTVTIPIVRDGEVVYGWDAVEAEKQDSRDGGRMMVVDITGLDWPPERVWALVAGLHRQRERTTVDQQALADLLLSIQQTEPDLLLAAGWGDDDLTDLLAAVSAPSLEALEDQHGSFSDADNEEFWPWIRLRVHPDTFRRWQDALDNAPGGNDTTRVEYILAGGLAGAVEASTPAAPEEPLAFLPGDDE
jgi:hypothetical protein